MPKWALFAARDGDVFRDEIVLQSEDAANAWAASRLADEFDLDDEARYDLDEAFSNCDGVLLEVATLQPIATILERWAVAQTGMLSALGAELEDELSKERAACSKALAELAEAAQRLT
jgi:hypothetical protein